MEMSGFRRFAALQYVAHVMLISFHVPVPYCHVTFHVVDNHDLHAVSCISVAR